MLNRTWVRLGIAFAMLAALFHAGPAMADGCIVADRSAWARLSEGHQIAVVRLENTQRATVDLFISLLDEGENAQDVSFVVPLGLEAEQFAASEKSLGAFEEALTSDLDAALRQSARQAAGYPRNVRLALLLGTLFVHGGWSWPIWLLLLSSGCSALGEPMPEAVFETESTRVAIYATGTATDLEALIRTTGLDPAARQTLERLRGQRIAVITLRTQPRSAPSQAQPEGSAPSRQEHQGLHLHWSTALVPSAEGPTYRYPLGTGSGWAQPIALTRVYLVAPPQMDFIVHYPALGEDLSGYVRYGLNSYAPRIMGAQRPAYAVDEAVGEGGRIWRVTYLESNAAEDIAITAVDHLTEGTAQTLHRQNAQRLALALAGPLSILIALGLWVVAWRLLMPRLLGVTPSWRSPLFWREALGWAFLYPVSNVFVGMLALLLIALTVGLGTIVAAPLLVLSAVGGVNLFFFVRRQARNQVPKGRAALAYLAVAGAANAAYLLYAVIYMALAGVL